MLDRFLKKEDGSAASGCGIGLAGLLTVLFVALKLTDNIDWSWVWVLSPPWIGFAAMVLISVVFFLAVAKRG